jgi:hypothetical protein
VTVGSVPPFSVAGRPGICASALRSYLEGAYGVQVGDAPAAGPDLHYVHYRHPYRVAGGRRCPIYVVVAGDADLATLD